MSVATTTSSAPTTTAVSRTKRVRAARLVERRGERSAACARDRRRTIFNFSRISAACTARKIGGKQRHVARPDAGAAVSPCAPINPRVPGRPRLLESDARPGIGRRATSRRAPRIFPGPAREILFCAWKAILPNHK